MGEFKVGDRVVDEDGDVCRIERIEGMMYQLLCRPDGPRSFLYWHTGQDELRSLEPLRQSDQTFHPMEHQFKVGDEVLDTRSGPRSWTKAQVVVCGHRDNILIRYHIGLEAWRRASDLRLVKQSSRRSQDQTFHRDAGKPDPTLIPSAALMQVVSVFEHGLEKGYEPRSWRLVPDAQARYLKSLARHFQAVLTAVQDGEEGGLMVLDPDGGRPHLAAIAADALILLDLSLRGEGK